MARLCPKRRNQPCPATEGCPMGKSLTGEQRRERQRRLAAQIYGWSEVFKRRAESAQRERWNVLKSKLLAVDVKDRPVLRPFIDISRETLEKMPPDVAALVCGHLVSDLVVDGA